MEIPGLSQLDDAIGSALDRAVQARHRSRLTRLGWQVALDAPAQDEPWATGGMLPKDGNAIELLVDGERAMRAIAEAIRTAEETVEIAGWIVSGEFHLPVGNEDGSTTWMPLRQLLAEAAERGVDVRVLVWGGVPVVRGSAAARASVRRRARELTAGTGVRCALDLCARPMRCHHEKVVVVDARVAFIGGIDLTDVRGRRCDSPAHPPRGAIGWHDVATRIEGPVVEDATRHVRMRWREATGETLPPAPTGTPPAGPSRVQLLRTVPERIYDSMPRGDFGMLEAHLRALRSARHLVYIENQFIWSPEIVEVLADKLRNPPSPDFRLLLVLPTKPVVGGDDNRGQLAELLGADATNQHILACTLHSHGPEPAGHVVGGAGREDPQPIYVHAKVCVVDDRWVSIGSANLNDHSLFNDTEVNVATCDAGVARSVREELWAEHLELPIDELAGRSPVQLIDELWRPIAEAQTRHRSAGGAPTHRLSIIEVTSKHSRRLLGPLQNMLVDA